MTELYETTADEELRPNRVTYNSLMNCYARSSDPSALSKAESILNKMQTSESKRDQPDTISYTTFLNVLAKSRDVNKATRAWQIVQDMEEINRKGNHYVKPNTVTYDTVLRACAFSNGKDVKAKRAALRVALETLTHLRDKASAEDSSLHATSYTYSTLFLACSNLTGGKEYARLIHQLFQYCCDDGVLHDSALQTLQRTCPPAMLANLLGSSFEADGDISKVKVSQLPSSWSRNAVKKSPDMKSERNRRGRGQTNEWDRIRRWRFKRDQTPRQR
mmetsp:Transcript_2984/g.3443  ORF Transcript_2984/g.3443 Transcript_2984/m.3443 type:complete len:275 (-) Transcript_2984:417-1241(-)